MNKQDEEKARELANDITEHGGKWVSDREVYEGCIEIVTWKEQQMIENAIKFISKRVFSPNGDFIEDFKKYMEEN